MPTTSFEKSIPVEFQAQQNNQETDSVSSNGNSEFDEKVKSYVITWRDQLRTNRLAKQNIWDECWQLYRGVEDWGDKEEWQTKISIPKAFSSVKQATNVIKRLLSTARKPWRLDPENPNDTVLVLRSEQMTDITKVFMDKANYLDEFAEGLECGFIMGLGVWKMWWGLVPKTQIKVETNITQVNPISATMTAMPPDSPMEEMGEPAGLQDETAEQPGGADLLEGEPKIGPTGIMGQDPFELQRQNDQQFPTQLPQEALDPRGWGAGGGMGMGGGEAIATPQYSKQVVQREVLEGRLFMRAVDPYNFYWLPGSKLNRWAGTIEDTEIPKWEMLKMAKQGIFDSDKIKNLQPMDIPETNKRSWLRFNERPKQNQGPTDTGNIKLTEFYGPLVIDGELLDEHAHVIIANDSTVLINGTTEFWNKKAPYVGFSPLNLPFRTEGVGLIEMVRAIDKALSRLANLSVDTLLFRLLPVFEVIPEVYENPEDFETGLTPGKIFRRNMSLAGAEGIKPIVFNDVSSGAVEVSAALDRAHQEGALVSEIQQAMPRYRGAQTATEIETKQGNQDSFFGSMAADIEKQAIGPLVELATDLIFQFIDTVNDPRVASILGVEADVIRGIPKEYLMEMIQGDWTIKVSGITEQLEKADMLQNLVQLMNIIGQNPQAWLPYINQDALLRRILESFRPNIHDIEQIIADPETVQANQIAMQHQEMVQMLPQLADMAHKVQQQKTDNQMAMMDKAIQVQQMNQQAEQAKAAQQTKGQAA